VPRGWDVVRLATEFEPAPPSPDDLVALADAVREASKTPPHTAVPAARGADFGEPGPVTAPPPPVETGRRGHLRVIRGEGEQAAERARTWRGYCGRAATLRCPRPHAR